MLTKFEKLMAAHPHVYPGMEERALISIAHQVMESIAGPKFEKWNYYMKYIDGNLKLYTPAYRCVRTYYALDFDSPLRNLYKTLWRQAL